MKEDLAKYNTAVLSALADLYIFMHLIDIQTLEQHTISDRMGVDRVRDMSKPLSEQIAYVISKMCAPESQERLYRFMDITDLPQRLQDTNSITLEFQGKSYGWRRARFIVVERDQQGKAKQVIFTVLDINTEKSREEHYRSELARALSNQNEIYSEMLQLQGGGFLATSSVDGEVLTVNEAALNLLGLDYNRRAVKTVAELIENADLVFQEDTKERLLDIERNGGSLTYEFIVNDHDMVRYIMANSKKITTQNGSDIIITTMSDITKNKLNEKALQVLSDTDSLSGIPNRSFGERKMNELLSMDVNGMFCLFDIDNFKNVNDTYGHHVGDKVIIEIAAILKDTLRNDDLFWRLGGDEFAFYAIGIEDYNQGRSCLSRLFHRINKINVPEISETPITISLGAVLVKNNVKEFYELYKTADLCMYRGKSVEGNHCEFYTGKKSNK